MPPSFPHSTPSFSCARACVHAYTACLVAKVTPVRLRYNLIIICLAGKRRRYFASVRDWKTGYTPEIKAGMEVVVVDRSTFGAIKTPGTVQSAMFRRPLYKQLWNRTSASVIHSEKEQTLYTHLRLTLSHKLPIHS